MAMTTPDKPLVDPEFMELIAAQTAHLVQVAMGNVILAVTEEVQRAIREGGGGGLKPGHRQAAKCDETREEFEEGIRQDDPDIVFGKTHVAMPCTCEDLHWSAVPIADIGQQIDDERARAMARVDKGGVTDGDKTSA